MIMKHGMFHEHVHPVASIESDGVLGQVPYNSLLTNLLKMVVVLAGGGGGGGGGGDMF